MGPNRRLSQSHLKELWPHRAFADRVDLTWEPVSGFEPLTCRLQEVRPRAPMPASCTDDTDHRTDGTHHAGIIRRAGPRTGPRRSPSCPSRPVTVRNNGYVPGGGVNAESRRLAPYTRSVACVPEIGSRARDGRHCWWPTAAVMMAGWPAVRWLTVSVAAVPPGAGLVAAALPDMRLARTGAVHARHHA
jgi:hypothetical protein